MDTRVSVPRCAPDRPGYDDCKDTIEAESLVFMTEKVDRTAVSKPGRDQH